MSLDSGFRYREILATKEEPALTRPQTRRILQKTTDYLEHFARFRRKENVEAVERLLTAHKELAKFERAQLGMSRSRFRFRRRFIFRRGA